MSGNTSALRRAYQFADSEVASAAKLLRALEWDMPAAHDLLDAVHQVNNLLHGDAVPEGVGPTETEFELDV
jgi:hypothetical protein